MPNALASQTSPYLRQHAENPVDWLPWGPEAHEAARARDVPLLVSIGYSACHWCHVMEHESFEDQGVAALMNEEFVCIKVDREERPDVDALYMEAVQGMTGHGGWPLNVFLTPEQLPFYGGTYFPPEPRHGLPSWTQVLQAIAETWRENAEEIRAGGERIREQLSRAARMEPSAEPFDTGALDTAVATLRQSFDATHGGFGGGAGGPRFPQTPVLEFLLRHGEREMSLVTLRAMAGGGIHDQLGGGFHRYSVDATWTVPHFEKMLYDNALLARAYLHAHRLVDGDGNGEGGEGGGGGDSARGAPNRDAESTELARVCRATLDWALREMRGPEGGFYSALDADSEGVEGRYYVWRVQELKDILGADADEAIHWLGVSEEGNFVDPHHPEPGLNVLTDRRGTRRDETGRPDSVGRPDETGQPDGIARPDAATRERIRARLLDARAARTRPGLDDKRLTSWNALMIAALADSGSVLDEPRYLEAAEQCAEFILRELREADGRLLRTYSEGRAHIGGYLEDHAFLLEALIVLFEATCAERWLTEARTLAARTIARFADPERGGFFSTPADGDELIARRKELDDSPIPSGASSAALGLLRLAQITGDESYEQHGLGVLRLLHEIAPQHPSSFGHLLQALQLHLSPAAALACAVPPARSATAGSSPTPPA